MAKKQSLVGNLVLLAVVVIGGAIAYKQIFLVSQISSGVPQDRLSRSIEVCMQENAGVNMLKQDLSSSDLSSSFDVGSLFGGVLDQLSSGVVSTKVKQNYISEIKVLKVQDFFGKNAEMRITGTVDLVSSVPMLGDFESKKDYRINLFKRAEEYYFDGFSAKKPETQEWDEWKCAQTL